MTILAIVPKPSPSLSGLSARGDTAGTGVLLSWVIPNNPDYFQSQVWVSTSNNRASATLAATIDGNSYFYILPTSQTRYFWVRSVNIYGYSTGAFEPVSSTGGVSATVSAITTIDIAQSSITKTTIVQDYIPKSLPTTTQILADITYTANGGVITVQFEHAGDCGLGGQIPIFEGSYTLIHQLFIWEITPYLTGGTVTFTNGSTTVTGSGTTFTNITTTGKVIGTSMYKVGIVDTVTSDTSLQLLIPWSYPTVTTSSYFAVDVQNTLLSSVERNMEYVYVNNGLSLQAISSNYYPYNRSLVFQSTSGKLYAANVYWIGASTGVMPPLEYFDKMTQLTIKEIMR